MSTSGGSSATRKLTLKSSDGKEFKVPEAVARQSHLIDRMIRDGCANDVIPIVNVTSTILKKVIQYCSKHADAIPDDPTSEKRLRNYDAKFVKVDQTTLLELMKAAEYMNIKSLMDLTCQTVTDMIKGKMPEEIRKAFDSYNDCTPDSRGGGGPSA